MRDKLAEDKTTALTNTTVGPKVLQTFFEKKLGYKATDSTWTGESFDKQFYLNIIKYQMSKKELVPDGMPGPKTTLAILTDM